MDLQAGGDAVAVIGIAAQSTVDDYAGRRRAALEDAGYDVDRLPEVTEFDNARPAVDALLAGSRALAVAGTDEVVVLRRLDEALAERDNVQAVLTRGPAPADGQVGSLVDAVLLARAGSAAAEVGGLTVAPAPELPADPPDTRPHVVVWSAGTAGAADRLRDRLADHFARLPAGRFADAAATLQRGRTQDRHRGAVVAGDARQAAMLMQAPDSAGHVRVPAPAPRARIVFLYPGVGPLHVDVARDLYQHSPDYARAFDECLDAFDALGVPLRKAVLDRDVHSPAVAMPLVFAVEYALTSMWRAWGVVPDAVAGHSMGEFAAATAAGVFTLADGVSAITVRSRLMADSPPGGMIVVAGPKQEVAPLLTGEVRIAVANGPTQVVVAGPLDELAATTERLEAAGQSCRQLRMTSAAHVPLLAGAVAPFETALRGLTRSAPTMDVYSAAHGRKVTGDELADPGFWARQLVEPVAFDDLVDRWAADGEPLLLVEVGPGRALTTVLRQHDAVLDGRLVAVPTLAQRLSEPLAETRAALTAAATVWAYGHPVDWDAVERFERPRRVSVPGYPYPDEEVAPAAQSAAGHEPGSVIARVAQLWSEVLGVPEIPGSADFFDIGGDSLTAVALMGKVSAEFGRRLGVVVLFDHPTLDELVAHLGRQGVA